MTDSSNWLSGKIPDTSNLRPLAQGGQKLVFSADHSRFGDVVMKVFRAPADPQMVHREVLAVQQVRSARVPSILDHGVLQTPLGECVWFIESRIAGQTVRTLLASGPMAINQIHKLTLHVLDALVAAELVGIVHRDVKPENIMLDGHGDFWLLDFGLARHLMLPSLTPTAAQFGKFTVGYAPPEQFRNFKREIDSRSDLFAAGVTLYECAIGVNPFRNGARDDIEILKRVERLPLPPLRLSCANGHAFGEFIGAMTQKQRFHRPPSVSYAYDWLQEILSSGA